MFTTRSSAFEPTPLPASNRPRHCAVGRRAGRIAVVLMALCLVAVVGAAQEFPTIERGFKPERAFQAGDIDQISLFNGSLSLAIPIGTRYPLGLGAELAYSLTLSYNNQVWDFIPAVANPPFPPEVIQAWPARVSNAGLGWRLSLGEYWDQSVMGPGRCPECYIGPDGAQHRFYGSLHPDVPGGSSNTLFTRDGTYLRLRKNVREIDFPNGEIHKFDAAGRLIQIRDRLGNAVQISHGANAWTISDGWRTHTVNLMNVTHYGKAVKNVVLQTFGGGQAVYTFNYAQPSVRRSCMDTDPTTSTHMTLPLLTGITLPDGSTYAMPVSAYETVGLPGECDQLVINPSLEGVLKEIKLPSRGKISWQYDAYNFPVPRDGEEGPDPLWLKKTTGVSRRALHKADGTAIGAWTYDQQLNGGQSATEAITKVTTPLGDRTDHYFLVGEKPNVLYGLPISEAESAPGRPDFKRSTKVYDCNTNGSGCVLERTTYLKYRADSLAGGPESNPRVEGTYTRFHDDGNRWHASDRSNFDGLGHYRTEVLSGNFGAGNSKTTITNYNPNNGTYPGSFTMPSAGGPWVLETFDYKTVSEGGRTYRSDHCFDVATGFRSRTRIRKSTTGALSANDVITTYTRIPSQSKIVEQRYGGDLQTVGTGALCTVGLGTDGNRQDNTYQYGVLKSSQYSMPNGSVVLKRVDRTIDRYTGLTVTEKDAALVTTTFVYDNMGRIRDIKPAQDAWVRYTYIAPGSQSAKVRIRTYPNGSFSGELTHDERLFDDFGRLLRERRRMPGNVWARRTTRYDAMSNLRDVSEWQADGPNTAWTRYRNHDPFGRPGYVDPPEGSSHRVTYGHFGERVETRKTKIGTGVSASGVVESAVTVTRRNDRQGRLHQVVDGTGTTTYTYDPAGRLSQVNMPGQFRQFNYDGRGFLTSERHPEKGVSGNGTVSYGRYDVLGNAGRRTDGPMSVDHVYDRASRLVRTRIPNGADLKVFTYGNGVSAGDRSRGKVKTADRYNYVTLGTTNYNVRVRETYTYGGRSGRTSFRDTQVYLDGTPIEGFTQALGPYDVLGNATAQVYPQCKPSTCTVPAPRTVTFGYNNGRLTSIPGWANNITYHRNGMMASIAHTNGVTLTQANDPWSRPRPRALSTSGAKNAAGTVTANWLTGTYIYDGENNVTQMGSGRYVYDNLSRLKSATFTGALRGGGPASLSQSYIYDVRGNRVSTTTNGATAASPAATSNRLTGAVSYDAAGNLTSWNGNLYNYDRLGKMWRMKAGSIETIYIYTADDERLWNFHVGENRATWTLRDLSGRVLREYGNSAGTWSLNRDYVHRDGQLLGAYTPTGNHHFHLDHVGSPRLITTGGGRQVAYHVYYPFGQEASSPTQDTERMKFTGHERDLNATSGSNPAGDDLDFMHARFYNPLPGRFLSVDPGKDWDAAVPQSWNLYAYARNNPLRYVDPGGDVVETAWDAFNVGLGVVSLVDNIRNRRFGSALLDVGGIVLDSVATAVPVVPGGVSTAIKAARVADKAVDTVKASKRGQIVIGHFPDYVEASNKMRIKRFQVKPDDWKNLEASGRTWEVNRAYLDRAIARGDEVVLATPLDKVKDPSFLRQEIDHLLAHGYKLSENGTKFIPNPGFK